MLPFDKLYNELVVPVSDLLAAFKALNRFVPISYGFKLDFVASNVPAGYNKVFIDKYLPVFQANLVPAGYNHPSSSIQGDLRWGLGDFLAECGGPAPAPP